MLALVGDVDDVFEVKEWLFLILAMLAVDGSNAALDNTRGG